MLNEDLKTNIKLIDLIYIENMTQAEFARHVGVSATSVNKWLNGRNVAARHRRKIDDLYPKFNILWGWKDGKV